MHAEAMSGVPTPLWFPPKVLERILAYEKEHALDRNKMIPLPIKAQKGRYGKVVKAVHRLRENPDSFKGPIKDPFLCIAIAFMQACMAWWIKQVNQEYGDNDEGQDDQADWWKA